MRFFIPNKRDSYKEETKNPPPLDDPHKRINVFILNKEKMTVLHVYTYIHTYVPIHTYTKMIHTHTQISYRKTRKDINVVMMKYEDVERRMNRW